ncbi:drug resistance transporter, EmrB/QacA subfamily [Frankineae bacterium MT45]|nr:drug resistance transporter, EmrB/QacA subfamily [Frankineae bacterium MT45]
MTLTSEEVRPDGHVPAAAEHENPHHRHRWSILGVLGLAQLMVVLDSTVVNIALPSAQHALGFSDSERQWIITAYALAFGSLLLLGGRLADLFGRKRIFLIGLAGFAIASAVGGAADGFGMLVTARAVQGAFGALLAPAALSLLTTTFTEPKERAKAYGIYGAIAGSGAGVGLLLGGILTEYLSWRWCMYVNLIFAVAAFVGGYMFLKHTAAQVRPKLDIPGAVVVSVALFSLVYGFAHAATGGWADAVTISFLAAGVILIGAFVYLQQRATHPLLPMRVLADRNRAGAYTAIFISGIGMFGVFLFLTYYLQATLGYSAVRSGLAFLPMVGVIMVVATVGTAVLATKLGPRWLIGPGMLIAAFGMVLLTRITIEPQYAIHILPGIMVIGAGLGLVFSSAMSLATSGVKADDAGVASALVNIGQQVGGSIGTALLSTLAATAATNYVVDHATSNPPAASVLANAAVHSYVVAFWWSAAIFAVGSLIGFVVLRGAVPEYNPDAEPVMAH